jgi:hypothetical protein
MSPRFKIDLPADVEAAKAQHLLAELKALDGVQSAGTLTTRGLDPASLGLWVQLASGIVATAAAAMPVLQKIVELVRGRGIKGAKLTFADGTTLSVDAISARALKDLLDRP